MDLEPERVVEQLERPYDILNQWGDDRALQQTSVNVEGGGRTQNVGDTDKTTPMENSTHEKDNDKALEIEKVDSGEDNEKIVNTEENELEENNEKIDIENTLNSRNMEDDGQAQIDDALNVETAGKADVSENMNNIVEDGMPADVPIAKNSSLTDNNGSKRRTIYEYHRVALNTSYITEGTVVLIHPQPTCNLVKDCETCVTQNIGFACRWCGIVKRCSDSVDWYRQKWLNAGCVHLSGTSNCSAIPTAPPPTKKPSKSSDEVAIIIGVVVIVLVLLAAAGGWLYYAYTHPTSTSGMWLIEHRPSQMKQKMQGMKFWKREASAGDKYAVESTA